VYICKFRVLFLSSGIGDFKRVIFGVVQWGGSTENKNPTEQGAGWGKNENIKKMKTKNVFYILYRVFSYFKNYSPI